MNRRRRELKRRAAAERMATLETAMNSQRGFIATPARPTLSYSAWAVVLFPVFILAGITAPVLVGQSLARALTHLGLSSYLTIWLVPGSSILIVVLFWKIYKRLGIRI